MTMSQSQLVSITDGKVTTSSRQIATHFKRTHKSIMRAIQNLDCSYQFGRLNFAPSSYVNAQNKEQPCYDITRDGFVFLCMGFTGAQAAQWKETYIATFNEMEEALRLQHVPDAAALSREAVRLKRDLYSAQREHANQRDLAGLLTRHLLIADQGLAKRVHQYTNAGLSIADMAKLTRCSADRVRRLRDALEACGLVSLRPNVLLARVTAMRISGKTPAHRLNLAESEYAYACKTAGIEPAITLGDAARAMADRQYQAAQVQPRQTHNMTGSDPTLLSGDGKSVFQGAAHLGETV